MAITYHDLFSGTPGSAVVGRVPDTAGTNAWVIGDYNIWQLLADGTAYITSTSESDIIRTGDPAGDEHHEAVSLGWVFGTEIGARGGVASRVSGSGGPNGTGLYGYVFWTNGSGYVELRRWNGAAASTSDVGGFAGGGLTQIPGITGATVVDLKLITRNNGADVELETWYRLDGGTWTQIGGTYTDVAPGAAFTAAGDDAVHSMQGGTATVYFSEFYSNTIDGPDATPPEVTGFTINTPNVNDATVITIDAFTASDDTSVTGYMLTESVTPPLAGDAGWAGTAQTTYDLGSYRSTTLYPWAKDAAGNVSAVYGTPIAVSASASGAPVVTNVSVADASLIDSHVFAVTITATDDVGVTGYAVTTSATPPGAAQQAGAVFSFDTGAFGDFNLYGWAFDAASNVSAQAAPVAVRSVDSTAVGATVFGLGFNGGINA